MKNNTDQGIQPYTYLRKIFEDFEKLTAESMRKNRRLREESQQTKAERQFAFDFFEE